jgi:hypothetical protein
VDFTDSSYEKPNITQVGINREYTNFGDFTDMKAISQLSPDCGLVSDGEIRWV